MSARLHTLHRNMERLVLADRRRECHAAVQCEQGANLDWQREAEFTAGSVGLTEFNSIVLSLGAYSRARKLTGVRQKSVAVEKAVS